MIDLTEAMEIAKSQYPELLISSIGKITSGWIISFKNKEGKELRISPAFVSEETGELKVFFPPDHREELKSYVKIDLEEQ